MGSYVPANIGVSGLTIPGFPAISAYLQAAYLAINGVTVYIGPDSIDGQFINILALQASDVNQALQAVWLSFNPQTAIGTSLDLIGKLIGTARRQSSYSTAILTLSGTIGALITNGQAQDTNGNFWNLPSPVTIGSGGTASVIATAEDLGNITANPNAINIIATPTAGWTGVTNAAAATPGQAIEPDSSYRARLLVAQTKPSLSILAGTAAAVAAVPNVTRSVVYENQYGFTAGFGTVNTSGTAITKYAGYPFDSTDVSQPIWINGATYSIASVGSSSTLTLTTGTAATTTGTALMSSTALTVAVATNIAIGQAVSGSGIAAGTTVTAISGLIITLSLITTSPLSSTAVTFTIGTQTNVPYYIGSPFANGPAHSITAVVEGGTTTDIAQAIYGNKNPGVLTNGTTSVTVTDPSNGGISLSISFDVLTYVEIYVALNIHPLNGYQSATTTAIQQAVLTYLDSLGIGEAVIFSQLYAAASSAQPNPLQPIFSIYAIISGYNVATTTASTTSGSSTIVVTSSAGILNGLFVVGNGIPPNTTVTSISGAPNIVLSAEATATASVPVTFFFTGTVDIAIPYNNAPSSDLAQVVINIV